MDQPLQPRPPSEAAPIAAVREHCADMASRAALYAQHVIDYCAIGDDRGAVRSLRLLATVAVAGADCAPLLAAQGEGHARLIETCRGAGERQALRPSEVPAGRTAPHGG